VQPSLPVIPTGAVRRTAKWRDLTRHRVKRGSPATGQARGDPSTRSLRSLGRDDRGGHPDRSGAVRPSLPVIPTGAVRCSHPSPSSRPERCDAPRSGGISWARVAIPSVKGRGSRRDAFSRSGASCLSPARPFASHSACRDRIRRRRRGVRTAKRSTHRDIQPRGCGELIVPCSVVPSVAGSAQRMRGARPGPGAGRAHATGRGRNGRGPRRRRGRAGR